MVLIAAPARPLSSAMSSRTRHTGHKGTSKEGYYTGEPRSAALLESRCSEPLVLLKRQAPRYQCAWPAAAVRGMEHRDFDRNNNSNLKSVGGATSSKPPNSRGVWVFTSSLNGCTKSQCRRGPSPRVLSLLLERGGSFETGTLTLHCILRVQPRASHEPHWKSNVSFSYHLKNCFVPASLFQHAAPCWFHHCAPSIALGLLSTTRDLSEVCRSDGKTGNTSSNHEY